jgi:hypothetical protein
MIRTQATPEQVAAFKSMIRGNKSQRIARESAHFVKPCLIEREDGWELQLPIKTEASNVNGNRHRAHKLKVGQIDTVLCACQTQLRRMDRERVNVLDLTRIGPRPLDAHDNLPQSFKHIVDAVCAYLVRGDDFDEQDRRRIGVFDDQLIGKGLVTCRYAQLTHELDRRLYGVRIRFHLRPK